MNILVITNNPDRASFRQRIGIYLDALREEGIECEVAKLPSVYLERRKLFKRASGFDAFFLQKKCLNLHDALWLKRYGKKIIYDFDDAVMYSAKTPASDRTSHFKLFRRTVKLADLIIAGNSYLAEHARRFNRNVRVLPTGLDTKAYTAKAKAREDNKIRLVWIGSKSTLRYLAEIKPALEEVGHRFDNVVLRIICDDFFDLQNMSVEKRFWSDEAQFVDLVTSDIGLAPLPDNRFTWGKCGFKILQYGAAALPVVTSPVGVNSEYVRDGLSGYLASEIPHWVEKLSRLVENAELREQMGNAGRMLAQRFDSSVIGRRLTDLIIEFVQGMPKVMTKPETLRTRPRRSARPLKPKVSICIPTFNRERYLKQTIDSILAQTYTDYEIVVVDDGSTDGTSSMLKELDFPIVYHWQENGGDAAARNKLIELAQGKYISFIDSDDLLLPDAIEKMVRVIEAENEDVVVYGSYLRIDENGNIYGRCKRKLHSGNITESLFQTIIVHACGSMFPRKILKDTRPFDTSLRVCSDYDFWLRLSLKYCFVALPEPTFKRRRHLGNLSGPSFENCFTELKVLERFYHDGGGKAVIPERIAMKVLSKEECRAGRMALKEGLYDQACQLLSQSLRQYPRPKSLGYWITAAMAKRLGLS